MCVCVCVCVQTLCRWKWSVAGSMVGGVRRQSTAASTSRSLQDAARAPITDVDDVHRSSDDSLSSIWTRCRRRRGTHASSRHFSPPCCCCCCCCLVLRQTTSIAMATARATTTKLDRTPASTIGVESAASRGSSDAGASPEPAAVRMMCRTAKDWSGGRPWSTAATCSANERFTSSPGPSTALRRTCRTTRHVTSATLAVVLFRIYASLFLPPSCRQNYWKCLSLR